ncbi:hypothetical protein M3E18_06845 [Kocuria sp. p3-SID1433]|uniref:Trm112 family protein n=1 Tax=unclassified Kocuria TaxID=2649579 RepID=UPI0021A8C621|nr:MULTISPECIES: hypothetical protein [unclassified Kocuria]MCT1602519.1 hypothetical protein [Kocuria sp. p3-SID1428]MCT2180255.1 hypothetical protein [Kocuria sp. p3-SID1433]
MTSAPGSSPSSRPADSTSSEGAAEQDPPSARSASRPNTGRLPWVQDTAAHEAVERAGHRGQGISELSAGLLEILRCPLTRGRLLALDEHHLMSELPHLEGIHPVYEITDGIPHLLPAQAMSDRRSR